MSDLPDQEEAIFAEALDLAPAERDAFVARACAGNAELLARVVGLLAAHAGPDSVFRDSPTPPTLTLIEKPGDRFDRYRLLQKIGEGGCGVVWMAEQDEPVRRRVALKVIKLGMDTKAVVARFEAERQALAMMNHPHIAKVLDGGATPAGRPYFVMELVRGIAITKFCDDHQLTMRARLDLFIQVCHAIQHAHQKGIIHRDIKPSNVLVALHDETPTPAVIDFGIAKATQGRLTDATMFTAFDQFLGTPAYMSPEQAVYGTLDIDTRSDIYSLGVLLYELLTGRLPFDPRKLAEGSIEEIRRLIREAEPARPSTRVRTLSQAERESIARLRAAGPAQLPSLLRGDLDWIVMKALEKNRVRRYQTANALALDVQRFLADEPVLARKPGMVYRTTKFVRRHRFGVAAAATVLLVLVSGVIAATVQAVRATRAERLARQQQALTVESRTRAENLLDFLLGEFRLELKKVGKLELLGKVDDQANAYFASLNAADLSDTALTQQARSLIQIGENRVAQGRYPDASRAFSAAFERTASLAARHPDNPDLLFNRAQAEYWVGYAHRRQGELEQAQTWFLRYRESAAALVAMDPSNLKWQSELVSGLHNLAVLRFERGELEQAHTDFLAKLAALQRMLAVNPADLELRFRISDAHSWLGSVAERRGALAEALERYAEETRDLQAILKDDPSTMRWRFELADSLSFQSHILSITGQLALAKLRLAEARKLADELIAYDASNRDWRLLAMRMRLRDVSLRLADGDAADAAELIAAARTELEKILATMPSDRFARTNLALAWRLEAELRERNDTAAAADAIGRALALYETQSAAASESMSAEYARACVVAAMLASAKGELAQARQHAARAFEVLESRTKNSNDARVLDPAARALMLLNRPQEGRALIERLERLGYRPLTPWPATAARNVSVRSN